MAIEQNLHATQRKNPRCDLLGRQLDGMSGGWFVRCHCDVVARCALVIIIVFIVDFCLYAKAVVAPEWRWSGACNANVL